MKSVCDEQPRVRQSHHVLDRAHFMLLLQYCTVALALLWQYSSLNRVPRLAARARAIRKTAADGRLVLHAYFLFLGLCFMR